MSISRFWHQVLGLLLIVLAGQGAAIGDTARDIGGLLACEAAGALVRDMPREPLYRQREGVCELTTSLGGPRFVDASCSTGVETAVLPVATWCASLREPGLLGDASALGPEVDTWLSTPGTRLPLTLPGLNGSAEPFLGRLRYRDIDTPDRGTCALEMRVYTANPAAQDQPALIALHGGSWTTRRAGFPGLESLMAHFTDRGFTVFAPFYRLVGAQDGPLACQQWSSDDLLSDAEAALDWVLQHGNRYGASSAKPAVFGQSAGGFLAAWLAVERSEDVTAALLMYPPTDVDDFVEQVALGRYANADGIETLEQFLGSPLTALSPGSPERYRLSLATRVADGETAAPLRMVHGLRDTLVVPRQSELLCAATASRAAWQNLRDRGLATPVRGGMTTACGNGGQLDLLAGAEHALEVCVPG
ncbi:MAG: alpha/beta hydrolase, partial [Pseudomonadota bacterium]